MIGPIANLRQQYQRLTSAPLRQPEDVVRWLGAVQAQEYAPAKWALGLRMRDGAIDAQIERAFADGRILRTHVMRPTWHFVTPADIGWMLELTAPRVHRAQGPYRRQLGLDAATLTRAARIFEQALGDGPLTRDELGARLARAGRAARGVALAHLALYAELEGIMCSGPRRGKQFTYALVAHRAPDARRLSRDESLAELARRYLQSHGPATLRDFVWWSGLLTADAQRGLDIIRAQSATGSRRTAAGGDLTYWTIGAAPRRTRPGDGVLLLPIYDEYLVAYRDRVAVPHGPGTIAASSGQAVIFQHALVIGGHVAGTWRTVQRAGDVELHVTPLRKLSSSERRAIAKAAERYGRFLGQPVRLVG